jgi:hypothetical protein
MPSKDSNGSTVFAFWELFIPIGRMTFDLEALIDCAISSYQIFFNIFLGGLGDSILTINDKTFDKPSKANSLDVLAVI